MTSWWESAIAHVWQVGIAVVGLVLWLARLESKANTSQRDISALEERISKRRDDDLENLHRDLDAINTSLGEVQRDIKKLLQRGQ